MIQPHHDLRAAARASTCALLGVLLFLAAPAAAAQEGADPGSRPARTDEGGEQDTGSGGQETEEAPPAVQDSPDLGAPLPGLDDAQRQLVELFHQVERKLTEIDLDLADAGAGDLPLEEVEDAGLEEFLRATLAKSTEVQEDIDRILDLAQQMSQGGGGGSSQSQPQGGESPLDSARDQGPQGRENTPEAPEQSSTEEGGEQQQPGGEEPQDGTGEQPGPDHPTNPAEDPSNREGKGQGPPPGRGGRDSDDAEQWGFLPARVREVFRNPGGRDLPVQYRDWIDTYYRRLNRTSSGS